jgi:hypothetical protein
LWSGGKQVSANERQQNLERHFHFPPPKNEQNYCPQIPGVRNMHTKLVINLFLFLISSLDATLTFAG